MIPRALSPQVCNGSMNATHMECWAPVFPGEMSEEKETGQIFIHMEDQRKVWNSPFEYHGNIKVFPFENDDKILLLKPGENEVSLHVCEHTLHPFTVNLCKDAHVAQLMIEVLFWSITA